jgi:hypothetical protein
MRGKNQMPPWGDFFKPDQLQALWAYVVAGERRGSCAGSGCYPETREAAA